MWVFSQAFGILNNLPEINTSISQHLVCFLMLVLVQWFQVMLSKHSLPWMQHLLALASMTALSHGTLKSIILQSHPHSIQSTFKCTNKQNLHHSPACPHCSVFRPQTSSLLIPGSLCVQAFYRSTRVLIMTWADFSFAQLSCISCNPEYSKEALSVLLLGESEMWKTIWPSKIIHWLLPRGNLSQTVSNSFHKACNSPTLESNHQVTKQRDRLNRATTLSLKHEPWW